MDIVAGTRDGQFCCEAGLTSGCEGVHFGGGEDVGVLRVNAGGRWNGCSIGLNVEARDICAHIRRIRSQTVAIGPVGEKRRHSPMLADTQVMEN